MTKAKRLMHKPRPINKGNENENVINESNEKDINKGNGNDHFDGLQRPVIKKMIDMMVWHHRMLPNQLPAFLHEYCVIHFIAAEEKHNASHCVYESYHCVLDSHLDVMSLSACLSIGETLTIWEKNKATATSAITFLQRENFVLVLLLATSVDFQNTGMMTFLLSIMHQVVKWLEGRL